MPYMSVAINVDDVTNLRFSVVGKTSAMHGHQIP